MQLMSDGFIHCDPHEGNLLGLPDGRVALLDFGLMAQMRTEHQEAMAHGVVNILGENYDALEQVLEGMHAPCTRHAHAMHAPCTRHARATVSTRTTHARAGLQGHGRA